MPTVQDVLDALESLAPSRFAFSFDRIGLQVGDPSAVVSKVAVSLDPSLAAVRFARSVGAQMLVCHHPIVWEPLKDLRFDSYKGPVLRELIEGGVAFAAAHTNWDCATGGINDVLAERLGLAAVRAVGSFSDRERTKVVVTVPLGSEDAVINAMSSAGAGFVGLYERCAFSVSGTGTFRGGPGTKPAVGSAGQVETVEESRIEMVCPGERVSAVLAALRSAHPYEEPAIDVYPVKPVSGQPAARLGVLAREMGVSEFREWLDARLSTRSLVCGPSGKVVRSVVVCGGAAADEWTAARDLGAEAFVTGEVPHHLMVEGSDSGVVMAACGHYATENPGTMRLADLLAERFEVAKFEPAAGSSGRPA